MRHKTQHTNPRLPSILLNKNKVGFKAQNFNAVAGDTAAVMRYSNYNRETEEEDLGSDSSNEEYNNIHMKWKPAKYQTYETMALTSTKLNTNMRPCGFRNNGKNRMIKATCLIARMKKLNLVKKTTPKMAVCITMYNENEAELKYTMQGVLQNYNAMYMDKGVMMR